MPMRRYIGKHGNLVEEEKDEQVERDEDAVDTGDQDQQQRVEFWLRSLTVHEAKTPAKIMIEVSSDIRTLMPSTAKR